MLRPSADSVALLLPMITVLTTLNLHNPAYIPFAILVALGVKHSFLPPLLRPLTRPEAVTRLKFNLFVVLHLVISVGFFPPYLSLRRGLVWYVDEYVQGRRGGQKSWASSTVQSAGGCSLLTQGHSADVRRGDYRFDSTLECGRSNCCYTVSYADPTK